MKRAITVLFALVLLASLFACNQEPSSSTASESPSASASAPASTGSDTSASPSPAETAAETADADTPVYGGIAKLCYPVVEGTGPIGLPWLIGAVDGNLLLPYAEALVHQYADGSLHPWLAESFEFDSAAGTITLKLREDVIFHDGSVFNAEVAVWNLKTAAENGTSAVKWDTATVDGPYQITVHFPDGITNMTAAALAIKGYCMISMESYEKNGEDWAAENPVGTGPFELSEYVKGAYAKYTKFDEYWDTGKPYLDGVEIEFIKDTMTQNIALQATGEQSLDLLNTTAGDQIKTFTDLGYQIKSQSLGPMMLMPDSENPDSPFATLEVRQALSYALDRDAIVNARGFGVWEPAYQIVASDRSGYSSDPDFGVPHYDPQKAKDLLAQAGYADGFKTTLYGQPGTSDKDAIVAVQAMLAEIGIEAELQMPDSGGYTEIRTNGWEGILVQSSRGLPTMESSFALLYDKERHYFSSMQYPQEAQDQLDAAYSKVGDTSAELMAMQKVFLDQFLVVPIYYIYDSFILKPNLNGYDLSKGIDITDLWFSE